MIKSASANTLLVNGNPVDVANSPLPLASGWNWIGYLPQSPRSVNVALASLTPTDDDLIKSQTAFATYAGSTWIGDLQDMEPGIGYRLFILNGGTLIYPHSSNVSSLLASLVNGGWSRSFNEATSTVWSGTTSKPDKTFVGKEWKETRLGKGQHGFSLDNIVIDEANGPDWSFDPTAFPHSMTVTAALQIDGSVLEESSTRLGAFVGDELRGVAQLRYVEPLEHYLAFLMVYSHEKDGEEIQFRIFDRADGTIHACAKAIDFKADARLGTPKKPLIFNAQPLAEIEDNLTLPQEFALAQNYPNPFNPSTTIRYELPQTAHVRIKIFDVLGRQVETLIDEEKEPGRYNIVVNAADLASGVYFYRIEAGDFRMVRKMLLLR